MQYVYIISGLLFGTAGLTLLMLAPINTVSYDANSVLTSRTDTDTTATTAPIEVDTRPIVTHVPQPAAVKAIYMTSCVVGTPSFRDSVVAVAKRTEVNTIVIDIKDFSGTLSYKPANEFWQAGWESSRCGARDMKEFIASLHDANIYVIGRITVFQDPFNAERHPEWAVKRSDRTTVWRDHKGLAFIEVGAKEYWDKIIDLSIDAYATGFDELNYDYVRYPSDGNMADATFPLAEATEYGKSKPANLEAFFAYLHTALTDEKRFAAVRHVNTGREKTIPWTSADLFGMTTTNTDDLSIGQVLERAVPYFDVIAPMVYPSHYPMDYIGLGDPNNHPYEIVYHAMSVGVRRLTATTTPVEAFTHTRIGTTTPALYSKPVYPASKLRTWIQDFDYGGDYDAADVRAQFKASYDAGVQSWMIWAPSNRYTESALLPETS